MTGWRIGYTGSNAEIAKLMGSIQSHQTSNPCSISQAAALEALTGPQNDVETMLVEFGKRNRFICDRIKRIPHLSAVEPKGAFYLFVDCSELIGKSYKGKTITSAADMAEILINDFMVVVIPCAVFGYLEPIRVSYAISQSDISKGMDRIEDFVNAVE
jgi:aspartate aminotransferase